MALSSMKKFNILNQLRLKETSVTCANCKDWLNGEVYIHPDCKFYCSSCSQDEADRRRLEVQEDLLKHMLFPCKYQECDYILKRDNISDHYMNCIYAPVQCGLCNDKIVNQLEIINHLESVHKDKSTTITLSKPELAVSVDRTNTNEIYIATFHQETFIIFIFRNETKLSVEVAKLMDEKILNEISEFTVLCTSNHIKYSYSKTFIQYSQVCSNDQNIDFIYVDAHESVNVEVRLCSFTNIMQMPKCPICMHTLKMEMYQCDNGHNICIDCGKKINRCATCQSANKHIVKLKHFLSNTLVMCPNADNGCLAVIKGDDIESHDKTCAYKMVKCALCGKQYCKGQVNIHFKEEKHELWDNCKHFAYKNESRTDYIKFKSRVFCVQFSKGVSCYLTVELLNCEDNAEAEKYKFEVHILGENVNDPIAKLMLQTLCLTRNTYGYICLLITDPIYKKYLVRNIEDKETPILNYRCIITESDGKDE